MHFQVLKKKCIGLPFCVLGYVAQKETCSVEALQKVFEQVNPT